MNFETAKQQSNWECIGDREALRQTGLPLAVDPPINMIRNFADAVPIAHFYAWTLPLTLPPSWTQTQFELFAS
jgi:hypothetical protein